MFNLSKNLKIFSVLLILYTIGFRFLLSYAITDHNTPVLWITAGAYFFLLFFSAAFLGKNEDSTIGVVYLGFKYHLATYIIFNGISLLWFWLEYSSKYETLRQQIMILSIWGAVLLLHFVYHLFNRKNFIKGIPKEEIFE